MVVGDVVSEIAADNVTLSFTPAAGVEVVVTTMGFLGNAPAGEYNLVNAGGDESQTNAAARANGDLMMKIFINNTNFWRGKSNGAGTHVSFTGMQVG